jgi:hypothetical protein
MKKIFLDVAYAALAAAAFALAPLFGFLMYGAGVQMFEGIGDLFGWEWLDRFHYWGFGFTWVILTVIFYWSWKLLTKYHPDFAPKTSN